MPGEYAAVNPGLGWIGKDELPSGWQRSDPGGERMVRLEVGGEPRDAAPLDDALRARIAAICEEGRVFWHEFDAGVRQDRWHPFVAADYDAVFDALVALRGTGRRFLEWGSATGVITIMADLLGYESFGIELDASLVEVSRDLAARAGSNARFAHGSLLPMGWEWKPRDGDGRLGTLGRGPSGYLELGRPLGDFDVVYAFPWGGEEPLMLDLMRTHGHADARLVLHSTEYGVRVHHRGRVEELGTR
jgi:hypothetical protein